MSRTNRAITLIGVDGGASRVRACEVIVDDDSDEMQLRLGRACAEHTYPPAQFTPVPGPLQREQYAAGTISLTSAERARGQVLATTIAECVIEVAQAVTPGESHKVLLGIGMPGLKSEDGRGVSVMNNGPRIPDLAAQIEEKVRDAGIGLQAPIRRLGSDGDYCGLGEEHAAEGLFRNVSEAYYVGGGTGLAEALKLGGKLVTLDQARGWIAKAWEMNSVQGATFEQLVSAAGINCRYREVAQALAVSECTLSAAAQGAPAFPPFPERRALVGDRLAGHVLETAAAALAELVYERIETVYRGKQCHAERGARYGQLAGAHQFRGSVLERVVLGQQLGRLFGNPDYYSVFRVHVEARLAELVASERDEGLRRWYLQGGRLRPGLLVASGLSASAVLGAAADALS